jgi:hypothetical protein
VKCDVFFAERTGFLNNIYTSFELQRVNGLINSSKPNNIVIGYEVDGLGSIPNTTPRPALVPSQPHTHTHTGHRGVNRPDREADFLSPSSTGIKVHVYIFICCLICGLFVVHAAQVSVVHTSSCSGLYSSTFPSAVAPLTLTKAVRTIVQQCEDLGRTSIIVFSERYRRSPWWTFPWQMAQNI